MVCEVCDYVYDDSEKFCPQCGTENPFVNDGNEMLLSSGEPIEEIPEDITICCPKCKSKQLLSTNRGFSTGKALVGGLAFGTIGILAGNIGASTTILVCQQCGERFPANKAFIYKGREHAINLEKNIVELMRQGKTDEAQKLYIKETNSGMMNTMQYFVAIYKKYGLK